MQLRSSPEPVLPRTEAVPKPQTSAGDSLEPGQLWALVGVLLATVLVVLDGTIVNVALPTISTELHVSASQAIWVVTAFGLPLAAVAQVALLAALLIRLKA